MTRIAPSLKAAAELKQAGFNKGVPTFNLNPRIIVVEDGFNGRPIDVLHVAKLKLARRSGAQMPPCVVEMVKGVPIMRDGHHRLYDVMGDIADGKDIKTIQCIEFKGVLSDRISLMLGSQGGLKMTPLQLGVQYKRLQTECGWTTRQIADDQGMSSQHVLDMIAFVNGAEYDVQKMVAAGEVKGTTAMRVVKKHGKDAGAVLAAGLVAAKAAGKNHVTPKNLGASYVTDMKKRAAECKAHLSAMLESPSLHQAVQRACTLVLDTMAGRKNDATEPTSLETGLFWLQELAANGQASVYVRNAARWFHDNLYNGAFVKGTAPETPGVMSVEDAIRMDMDSDGDVIAETFLSAEQRALIVWLRSGRK